MGKKLPYKYNLRKSEEKESDLLFKSIIKDDVSIKDTDYRSQLPPIWDQGELGSCQSHAIDAIVSYLHKNDFDPSRLFTYYNIRSLMGQEYIDQDCGGDLQNTCDAVRKFGVCPSNDLPYDISKFTDKPSDKSYADATKDEIYTYYRVKSVTEALQALSQGHLILLGINVYENFQSEECLITGVVPSPKGEIVGGHALVICSSHIEEDNTNEFENIFDQLFNRKEKIKGNFIIRNSWGLGNGLPDANGNGTGYYRIDFDVFEELLMDMFVIVK